MIFQIAGVEMTSSTKASLSFLLFFTGIFYFLYLKRQYLNTKYDEWLKNLSTVQTEKMSSYEKTFGNMPLKLYMHGCNGRLGNFMLQYAALYGLAKTTKRMPEICACLPVQDIFKNLTIKLAHVSHYTKCKAVFGDIPNIHEREFLRKKQYRAKDMIHNISSYKQNLSVTGFFVTMDFWQQFVPEIQTEFQFSTTISQKAWNIVNMTIARHNGFTESKSTTIIGIHVRRTDRIKMKPSDTYYHRALDIYRNCFKNLAFLVVSDDKVFCKHFFSNESDVYITPLETPAPVDLAVLTMCNHTIISTGTYGWWGAFLSGGISIYSKQWGIYERAKMDCPKTWIEL